MPGTFIFRPIEANLTHDTDWLGNMDPYCAYMVNNKRIKGQVCKSGGQHPIWNEATTVPMEIDQPACVVELMDKDTFIDDSIGTFVIDLNEVRNNGALSKWYPVFHKNKPAGQILFEAAFQPEGGYVQNTVQYSTPVIAQEIPKKAMIEETVITKQVLPQETYTQSTFLSKGGVIPIGSQNLDGGLYGKVVHAEAVSHYPEQHLSGTQLHQETLPRTQLGGPLSGSLGGGVLGTRELGAQGFVGGSTYISTTTSEVKHASNQQYSSNQYAGTNLGGTNLGGTNLGGSNLYGSNLGNINTQNLGNQYLPTQGSNLQDNFNAAHISNAGLGGLYKESIAHPVSGKSTKAKVGQALPNAGNVIPGDLVGGHSQTNKNFGDQAL